MLAGHFTTAIIAKQQNPSVSLIFFLVVSQLQDLSWFVFHYLGLETTTPDDAFNATLNNMEVDMLYSHDLIPLVIWCGLAFAAGSALYKNTQIGLVSAGLVAVHFIFDFFSGHLHHFFGSDSIEVGLGLYATRPYLAILIEAVVSAFILGYFFRKERINGVKRSIKNKIMILSVIAYGIVFMTLIATRSFREIFGIPAFELGFNSTVPTLIFTYGAMLYSLHYFVTTGSQTK